MVAKITGEDAISCWRTLMGPTEPRGCAAGFDPRRLRDRQIGENIVHGSDSAESAARELKLFFG